MLTLEITESSLLIDAPRARATINELHEVGVRCRSTTSAPATPRSATFVGCRSAN
jgi:hypothetical protein